MTNARKNISLVELLDRVLDKGAVVSGDVMISMAGIELIYLDLKVLISSYDTMRRLKGLPPLPNGDEKNLLPP